MLTTYLTIDLNIFQLIEEITKGYDTIDYCGST